MSSRGKRFFEIGDPLFVIVLKTENGAALFSVLSLSLSASFVLRMVQRLSRDPYINDAMARWRVHYLRRIAHNDYK